MVLSQQQQTSVETRETEKWMRSAILCAGESLEEWGICYVTLWRKTGIKNDYVFENVFIKEYSGFNSSLAQLIEKQQSKQKCR